MIRKTKVSGDENKVEISAILAAGNNVSLNPEYIIRAIEKYLPELTPDFAEFTRKNVLTENLAAFR